MLIIYYSLALLATALASYFDIRTRKIPVELTLGLLGLALSLHFLESGLVGNPGPLVASVISAITAYVILYIAWKVGLIAGGDAKLLTALNALIVSWPRTFPWVNSWYLAFLPILWNGILASLPFLLVFSAIKLGKKTLSIITRDLERALGFAFLVYSAFNYYSGNEAWLFFIVLSFLPYKWILLAVPGILAGLKFGWNGLLLDFLYFFSVSVFLDLMLGSRKLFVKRKKVDQLEEGDILAEVIVDGKRLEPSPLNFIKGLKLGLVPLSRGLTREEIEMLRKWGINEVLVQESIPFTPIILLGLIVSIFLGDLIWLGVR